MSVADFDYEKTSVAQDDQYHHYTGNAIPWYVRVIWLGFWIFAVTYTVRLLFPAIQRELFEKL